MTGTDVSASTKVADYPRHTRVGSCPKPGETETCSSTKSTILIRTYWQNIRHKNGSKLEKSEIRSISSVNTYTFAHWILEAKDLFIFRGIILDTFNVYLTLSPFRSVYLQPFLCSLWLFCTIVSNYQLLD